MISGILDAKAGDGQQVFGQKLKDGDRENDKQQTDDRVGDQLFGLRNLFDISGTESVLKSGDDDRDQTNPTTDRDADKNHCFSHCQRIDGDATNGGPDTLGVAVKVSGAGLALLFERRAVTDLVAGSVSLIDFFIFIGRCFGGCICRKNHVCHC